MKTIFTKAYIPNRVRLFDSTGYLRQEVKVEDAFDSFLQTAEMKMNWKTLLKIRKAIYLFKPEEIIVEDK